MKSRHQFAMYAVPLGIFAAVAPTACVDTETAHRVLENEGMTDIETTGYRYLGCSKGDTFNSGFKATNANGKHVEGVVCNGLFKGATIRFD